MNCPFCQQLLPENQTTGACPYCSHALPSAGPTPGPPPRKINLLWFWVGLLAPPLLTTLSAFLGSHGSNDNVSPAIALIGSGIGGITSGIVLGTRLGKETGARVGLSFLFAAIFVVVCFVLSFCGCNLGGYRLDLK